MEIPLGSGNWTITFGNNPPASCIARSDPRWWECGVFKGVHFGFYSDDPIVNLLNPDSSVWSQLGPPCVYFGPNGETIPCTGLTSHAAHGFGQIAILNATASAGASAAAGMVRVKSGAAQGLRISNVRIAVVPDAVPINNLGPCDLRDLAWQNVRARRFHAAALHSRRRSRNPQRADSGQHPRPEGRLGRDDL